MRITVKRYFVDLQEAKAFAASIGGHVKLEVAFNPQGVIVGQFSVAYKMLEKEVWRT